MQICASHTSLYPLFPGTHNWLIIIHYITLTISHIWVFLKDNFFEVWSAVDAHIYVSAARETSQIYPVASIL
jgi:hypothetical protein